MILFPGLLGAQEYILYNRIDMEVAGTSTLHDWEMVSEEARGRANFILENKQLKEIKDLSFSLETETLKSGKGPMDKICYESMKTKKHKNITFQLLGVNSIKQSANGYTILARGNLQIAGVKKTVVMNVKAIIVNGTIEFIGSYKMKMTDYDIDPPTALFGTIKTGNDLDISFKVKYKTTSNI